MKLLFFLIALVGVLGSHAQTPAAIETELLAYLKTMGENGSYSGAYDEAKLNRASVALKQKLLKYATRADVLKYYFPKLREEMFVATSKDGKFRIYSWDLESGGTMHKHDAITQYVGRSGKVIAWTDVEFEGAQAFYVDVFQLNTASGPIYMLVWTAWVSSSFQGQGLNTARIVGDKLNVHAKAIRAPGGLTDQIGFFYDFLSVVDRPERPIRLFTFNEARREFSYPVVDVEDKEMPGGRVTNKLITYRFNGTYFVKVR